MEQLGQRLGAVLGRLRAAMEPGADARNAEAERLAREAARADRERRMRAAGVSVSPEMWSAIAGGAVPRKTASGKATAEWWSDRGGPRILILSGGTGCGKSVAGCWAIAQHERGGRLRSASVVAQFWRSGTVEAAQERQALASCGVLVLDDVGAEHASHREWLSVALRDLLDLRQADHLRTVLTTNLTQERLEQRYADHRLVSRLQRALWITDTGADLRSKKP